VQHHPISNIVNNTGPYSSFPFQDVLLPSYVYQIYEVIDGKDLLELFNSNPSALTENLIRYVFYQVVEVVHRVHLRGVVHLDIKPENVMFDLTKTQIVLIDFGFSEVFDLKDPISITKKSGSIEYCAPEIYFESLYDGRFADVWSLGVLLYVLLFRRFPFNIKLEKGVKLSRSEYLQAMFEEKVTASLVFPDKTASSLRSLLCGMLAPNPEDRLDTYEILTHEWFSALKNPQHNHIQQQTLQLHFKHNSKYSFNSYANSVSNNNSIANKSNCANDNSINQLNKSPLKQRGVSPCRYNMQNNPVLDRTHNNSKGKIKNNLLKASFHPRTPHLSQPLISA